MARALATLSYAALGVVLPALRGTPVPPAIASAGSRVVLARGSGAS